MAVVQTIVRIDADPTKPTQEICAVINVLASYHKGQEERILLDVKEAIDRRLLELGKPRDRPVADGQKNEPKKKDK